MTPGSNAPQETRARKPGQRRSRRWLAGLSAGEVADDQRRRLIAAMPAALAEHGYEGTAVEGAVRRAHVSRHTLYELFGGKDGLLHGAFAAVLAGLSTQVKAACGDEGRPGTRLRCAVGAALGYCAAEPARGRLLAADPFLVGPHAGRCRELLAARLGPALRQGRRGCVDGAADALEFGLLGGAATVVAGRLRRGHGEGLVALEAPLAEFMAAPYRRANGA